MKTIFAGTVITGLVGLTAGWFIYPHNSPSNSKPVPTLPPFFIHPASQDSSHPASIQQFFSVSEQDAWLADLKNEATLDPAKALKDALDFPSQSLRVEALSQVMLGWLSVDSEAALNWALNLPDTPLRQTVLTSIGYELSRTQPELAGEILNKLPDDAATSQLAAYIAMQRSLQNPLEAYLWADSLPHGDYRTNALSGTLTIWAESNPGEAANLATTSLPAGDAKECTIANILIRWTQQEPDSATDWVSQQISPGFFKIELSNLLISINQIHDNGTAYP